MDEELGDGSEIYDLAARVSAIFASPLCFFYYFTMKYKPEIGQSENILVGVRTLGSWPSCCGLGPQGPDGPALRLNSEWLRQNECEV